MRIREEVRREAEALEAIGDEELADVKGGAGAVAQVKALVTMMELTVQGA